LVFSDKLAVVQVSQSSQTEQDRSMAHDVFISYSAKDKTTADAVCAVLEGEGIRCWIAPRDVVPGMEWGECIIEAIEQTRVMVLVFTADANASPQIRREVERAVNHGVAILPLRIENVMPGRALEYFIGNVHWLDALTPPLEAHLKNLAGTVRLLLVRMGTRNAPSALPVAGDVPQAAKPPEAAAVPPAGPVGTPSAVAPSTEISQGMTAASPRSWRLPMRTRGGRTVSVLFLFAILAVGLGFWGYAIAGSDYLSGDCLHHVPPPPCPNPVRPFTWLEAMRCLIASIGLIRLPELFQPGTDPWQLVIAQVLVPGVALVSVVQLILIGVRKSIRR
jgi:hypothetical protein